MKEAEKENKVTASAPRFDNGGRQSTTHTNCGHPALHQQERRRRADAPRRPSTRHKRAAAARRAGICLRGGAAKQSAARQQISLPVRGGGGPSEGGLWSRGRIKTHLLGQWPTRAGVRARTGTLEERKALEAWRKCVLQELRINAIKQPCLQLC